jgi:phosphoribosylformimino-5-aminoimidazole carboxamide ribotide isomerase
MNARAVDAIVAAVAPLPVQLGGGIRDLETIERWLEKGVARVILGTVALRDPALVKEACRLWPTRIVVGIDAREGHVAVEGWAEVSKMTAHDLALMFEDAGAAAIVYTDIERDGALAGVNVDATADLARRLSTPVIASGGVASLADISALKAHEKDGVAGAILGRALYDGRIDLAAALTLAEG